MTEKKRILIWLGIMLAVVSLIWMVHICRSFYVENRELHDKVDRLQYTLAHSTIGLQRDTIRDSIPVVTQQVITIDKTNYKKMEADKELIADLKLKIAQVESENRTLLATQGQVVFKTAADSDSILRYADKWCDFTYLVKPKKLSYNVRDSLTTIVSREYKHKFLWWRWGTKGYNVHIVNHNPSSEIMYNRYIKVERK